MAAQRRSWEECDRIITAPGSKWELVEEIVEGRPTKVWKNAPRNAREFLMGCIAQHRNNIFVSSPLPEPSGFYDREHLTFGQVYEKALRLAAWLRDNGVRQGGRVAVGGSNSTGWVVSMLAVNLLGAVPVFLNNTLVVEAQIHCLAKTNPTFCLVDAPLAEVLAPRRAELEAKNVGPICCWSSTAHFDPLTRGIVKDLSDPRPSSRRIQEVVGGVDIHKLGPDSDGVIFFTSGTTSMPKAVLSTQRASLHSTLSGQISTVRWFLRQGGDPAAIPNSGAANTLLAVPMFHVTGCLSWLLKIFRTGSKVVFMRKWNVPDALRLIQDEDIEVIGGVPAIITSILQSPLLPPEVQFTSMSYGGAPSTARMVGDLNKRFPKCFVSHGYGMTETNALHVALAGGDYVENPTSTGLALPGCEMRITDPESKQVLPINTMGVVEMRGFTIMKCYVNDPAATAAALSEDGWLDSGDMGFIDDDGLLHIRDRQKDIIIRGGENIPSAEVESAVAEDDRVAEVAAVPVPCPVMGERVGVAISLAPGTTATEEEIMKGAEAHLRYPARPVIVYVSKTPLPRNANGKVLKNKVKEIVVDIWNRENRVAKYAKAKPETRAKL